MSGRRAALLFAGCAALGGCGARTGLDDLSTSPSPSPDAGGASCDPASLTAYLMSLSGELFKFDPTTITIQSLGVPSCPTSASAWTFSVSRTGVAYVLHVDWRIWRVDLTTLTCSVTPYVPFQLGFGGEEAIAVSRDAGEERLYVYGSAAQLWGPLLAVTDFTTFVLTPVGQVKPPPTAYPLDMQGNAQGKLFALSQDGEFVQMSTATGTPEIDVETSFASMGGGHAIMTYGPRIYFFGNAAGDVYLYDPETNQVTHLGAVNAPIIGASAAPCGP
jgi:hypothetical protein